MKGNVLGIILFPNTALTDQLGYTCDNEFVTTKITPTRGSGSTQIKYHA
jgi:hypothetical protein